MNILDVITLDSRIVLAVVFLIVATLGILIGVIVTLKSDLNKFNISIVQRDGTIREKDLTILNIQSEIKVIAQNSAIKLFDQWKTNELDAYKKIIDTAAAETAGTMLNQWKMENEARIRKDAANRSVRVVLGKVTEHLVPFTEIFRFNPRDTRFIGNPIDLIVFDGVDENKDEITIFFIEIKTGTSSLSTRQRKIREAIESGRVEWVLLSLKDFGESVKDELDQGA